jgi:hypothetical protein
LIQQGRFGPFGRYSLAESYFHASEILLSYFHFVFKGDLLFSSDSTSSASSNSFALTPDQMHYVEGLKKHIRDRGTTPAQYQTRDGYIFPEHSDPSGMVRKLANIDFRNCSPRLAFKPYV